MKGASVYSAQLQYRLACAIGCSVRVGGAELMLMAAERRSIQNALQAYVCCNNWRVKFDINGSHGQKCASQ